MSMSGNPHQHFEEATGLLADSPGEYEIEKSKALATLALAYEQRTANLIAMYTDGNTGTAPGVNYKDLLEAITERLDIA
jgi:hypothetical protein